MSELLTVRLPKIFGAKLRKFSEEASMDKSALVRELLAVGIKEKELQKALGLYKEGKISLWKASRIAGVSLWKMIDLLKERKIEAQYGLKELESDLSAL